MTSEILDTVLTIIAVSGVSGLGTLFNNKKINKLQALYESLRSNISEFREEYAKNEKMMLNVAFSQDTHKKINHLIQDAVAFLSDNEDTAVAALIARNGEMAKECMDWAVLTNLDGITTRDCIVKYETHSISLRDNLEILEPDFADIIRPTLAFKGKKYIYSISEIVEDKIPNSRVMRFVTATERSLQEIITYIIKERVKYKLNKEVK